VSRRETSLTPRRRLDEYNPITLTVTLTLTLTLTLIRGTLSLAVIPAERIRLVRHELISYVFMWSPKDATKAYLYR